MMTLLLAVFMVLFAISSANISKSSPPAFAAGRLLGPSCPAAARCRRPAATTDAPKVPPRRRARCRRSCSRGAGRTATPRPRAEGRQGGAAGLQALKQRSTRYVEQPGSPRRSRRSSRRRPEIRLMTDGRFSTPARRRQPGGAACWRSRRACCAPRTSTCPRARATPTRSRSARPQYPSNWQLSAARAAAVVRACAQTASRRSA